jgi:hypothetical protein
VQFWQVCDPLLIKCHHVDGHAEGSVRRGFHVQSVQMKLITDKNYFEVIFSYSYISSVSDINISVMDIEWS